MKNKWGKPELLLVVWGGMALLISIPVTVFLQASFPLFTVIWLIVPLLVVIRTSDAGRAGIIRITWRAFLITSAINLLLLLGVSLAVEPWSHAYRALVRGAIAGTPPDSTFAWLIRFKGIPAWGGIFLYSGLVTIFGEELFFRGWLLKSLLGRMNEIWAVLIQAALFTIPQLLAAFLLAPIQGVIYAIVYCFLGVGVVGGWAAARTRSIWPSLVAATVWNVIMIIVVT